MSRTMLLGVTQSRRIFARYARMEAPRWANDALLPLRMVELLRRECTYDKLTITRELHEVVPLAKPLSRFHDLHASVRMRSNEWREAEYAQRMQKLPECIQKENIKQELSHPLATHELP